MILYINIIHPIQSKHLCTHKHYLIQSKTTHSLSIRSTHYSYPLLAKRLRPTAALLEESLRCSGPGFPCKMSSSMHLSNTDPETGILPPLLSLLFFFSLPSLSPSFLPSSPPPSSSPFFPAKKYLFSREPHLS